jgi:DNA-binding LacI/PurR family transcriptional regulator
MLMTTVAPKTSTSLVTALGRQLRAGVWPAGARLSTRDLGKRLGAHRATVQRALLHLQEQGLVECRPRSGWYVRQTSIRRAAASDAAPSCQPLASVAGMHVALSLGVQRADELFIETSWTGIILANLRRALAEHEVDLMLWSHDPAHDPDPQEFAQRLDQSPKLLGVVAVNPMELASLESVLDDHGVPWVTVNRRRPSVLHNFVSADNARAGRVAGMVFARMGWTRLGVMLGNFETYPSEREKFEGLCGGYASVAGALPSVSFIPTTGSTQRDGFEGMSSHLASHEAPQAVFCGGDNLALGAIRACQQRGLRVPRDIGIIGNSGFEHGEWSTPRLTTFTQPMAAIGRAAGELLLHMRQQGLSRVPGRVVAGEFIVRDSLHIRPDLRRELDDLAAPVDQPDLGPLQHTLSALA